MENLISVVVCTYNQEDTIGRTLDSILMQQCHVPFEIIIGEDCSTDATLAICQHYAKEHPDIIRLFANSQNRGLVDNYFDCLLAARGRYIADCAGDDFWTDSLKLEKEVHIMEKHPNVSMVLTRWNWFDEYSLTATSGPLPPFPTGIVIKGSDMLEAIITQTNMNVFHLCTSLYRKDVFLKAYQENTFMFRHKEWVTEDIQIALSMARYGDFFYLPDVTLNYSIGKVSASNTMDDERQFHFVKKVMDLCYYLTQHYQIQSSNINHFFSRRLFSLSMHAFRSHEPELYQETLQCEKDWQVHRTVPIKIAYMVMSNKGLWKLILLARKQFVATKRLRNSLKRNETDNLYINYTGRLGNQLFTYAFARYLLYLKPNTSSIIANFQGTMEGTEEDGFSDSIHHFNCLPYHVNNYNLIRHYGSLLQKMVYYIYFICTKIPFIVNKRNRFIALNKSIERFRLYYSGAEDWASTSLSLPRHGSLFVSGLFQDKKNFDAIRPILMKELTPKCPLLEQNVSLYHIITNTNSVCVSVRRGDFLSSKYKDNFYICTPSYFEKAIRMIKEKVTNPVFVFFSDDIEWVRNNLHDNDCPCYYETGSDPVWEKLRLMYSCHHFIISNSTFSWWAQYLGRYEDKIVISPSRWYANSEWTSNLIEDTFITIDP